MPVLALEREQVAHLVVAIGDVDAHVFVVDLVADEPQLARVGVHARRCRVRAAQVTREVRLLVRPLRDVLRLDQADGCAPGRPIALA